LAGVAILALSVACGTPEPRGRFGTDSSPASAQPTYNPLTPTAPVTIADVQQQLSFPLRLPGVLPAGLVLQQAAAWPAEDSATFNYTNATGTVGFQLVERSRPWTTADALWPPHATLEQSTLLFGAQPVTRYVAGWEGCGSGTGYVWEQAGVSVAINAGAADDASRALLEQFIAAVIGVAPEAIVAPTATPTPATPVRTPYGEYCDLTAAQAIALAPFDVRLPTPPAPLAITRVQLYNVPLGLEARASPPATVIADGSVTLNAASARFTASDAWIELYEVAGDTSFFGGPPPLGERSTITLAGVDVYRERRETTVSDNTPARSVILRYSWQQAGLTVHLNATLAADASVTQAEVEQLIANSIAGN
jgi:hypothetical protein